MPISTLPTTVTVGQTGHAALHNNANTAINSILNRVQDAMTGATAAARFVGASAGAPAFGTFLLGDFIWDTTALGYRSCTVAGSPGTWGNPIAPLTSTNPVALGAVAVGTANAAARQDHVHPTTGLQLLSTYTTKGDILAATASAAVARLGVGADNTALIAASGQTTGLNWAAVQLLSTYTAKGDVVSATGSGAVQRNAVGSNNTVLVADSAQAGGVKWAYPFATPELVETNATVTTTLTIGALTLGTQKNYTLTGSTTFTMPTAAAGASFLVELTQDATGSRVPTFTGVTWAGGSAPTFSTGANKKDVVSFVCVDGSHWIGMPPVLDVH